MAEGEHSNVLMATQCIHSSASSILPPTTFVDSSGSSSQENFQTMLWILAWRLRSVRATWLRLFIFPAIRNAAYKLSEHCPDAGKEAGFGDTIRGVEKTRDDSGIIFSSSLIFGSYLWPSSNFRSIIWSRKGSGQWLRLRGLIHCLNYLNKNFDSVPRRSSRLRAHQGIQALLMSHVFVLKLRIQ
jgi:hypothetical protein